MKRMIGLVLFKPTLQADGVENVEEIDLGSFYATIYQSELHYDNKLNPVGVSKLRPTVTYVVKIGNLNIIDNINNYIAGITTMVVCIKRHGLYFKINNIDPTHYPTVRLYTANEQYQHTI